MAQGAITPRTSVSWTTLAEDLTDYQGHGVYLNGGDGGALTLASLTNQATTNSLPFWAVITAGGPATAPGAVEVIDRIGSIVQAKAGTGGVAVNAFVECEYSATAANRARFITYTAATGNVIAGRALSAATEGNFFTMEILKQPIPYAA